MKQTAPVYRLTIHSNDAKHFHTASGLAQTNRHLDGPQPCGDVGCGGGPGYFWLDIQHQGPMPNNLIATVQLTLGPDIEVTCEYHHDETIPTPKAIRYNDGGDGDDDGEHEGAIYYGDGGDGDTDYEED